MTNIPLMMPIIRKLNKHDLQNIKHPRWELTDRVHDWRNYIPIELQDLWGKLSSDVRIAAYYMAVKQADDEDWD